MNRMFLKSTLPLSQTVVKAVKNGLSKDNLFMLSHQTMRRKHGTSMGEEAECALISAAKKAKLSEKEIVSIIMTEGISLGQINYALLKDKQQMAAKTVISRKKNKKTDLSKVLTKVARKKRNWEKVHKSYETKIKESFSSPLKAQVFEASAYC